MNITPSTNLHLLRGVPITNNYKDTLYFASKTDQYNYFYSKRIQTYSDFTYQRVESGKVRVALGAESCYSCNYLMFQNENFGTKWFYAFITGVEYVNNACTEITYEIDKVQTWFYDLTLKPCMVVRQHAVNDGYYVNCEPENFVDDAEYVSFEQDCTEGNVFIILSTGHIDSDGYFVKNDTFQEVNHMPCSLEINFFQDTTAGKHAFVTFMQKMINAGREQDIICAYCASAFSGYGPNAGIPTFGDYGANKQTLRTGAFQGYVPKNNKMYNYPFCKLAVKSPTTQKIYSIEDFRTGTGTSQAEAANFYVYAVTIPTPALLIVPRNYRGEAINYDEGIEITDFPYIPFTGDTYKMWSVQNNGGYLANFAGQLANLAFSLGGSDAVGSFIGVRQAVQEGANWIGQNINASNRSHNTYGLQKGNIMSNLQKNGFRLQCLTYDYWKARQVDSYFTMYGYAENHVMVPNIHARQKWTYVQTRGCTLVGNAPSDDISFIEDCFDRGITWWVNPSEVGNYDLTNATL